MSRHQDHQEIINYRKKLGCERYLFYFVQHNLIPIRGNYLIEIYISILTRAMEDN